MKKLKIAQVSPLWYSVPPKGYGGTELIVSRLTEGLIKRGHKVTLFASGDSKTKAKLVSVVKKNLYSLNLPWSHTNFNILNLIEAFSQEEKFDIIHTHIDPLDVYFRAKSSVKTVATFHNFFWNFNTKKTKSPRWFDAKAAELIYSRFPKLPHISISDRYKELCPVKINFAKTIYHGIDLKDLKFSDNTGDYFVWYGRFTSLKGAHIAVQLARKAGEKLILAGVFPSPENKEYFDKTIKPYLSRKIKFIGPLMSDKEKSGLLKNAKGLIYPLLWEEPFGIVMVEAMACGVPVIAFQKGAAPEIVKHNSTGFIVKTEKEMLKAIKKIDSIKRKDCRKLVEKNFTTEKMVQDHEKLYYQLIK